MKPALRLLSKLAHETGVHIFTSHHTKKGDLGPDSLLGSVAIAGGVDGIMLLDWKQESGERTLATYKQRYPDGDSLAPTLIGLDLDTYRIESLGLKRADRKGIEENILDVLTGLDEPMKRESLLQAVGGRKETAIRALHRLEETLKVDVIRREGVRISASQCRRLNCSRSREQLGTGNSSAPIPIVPCPAPLGAGTGTVGGNVQNTQEISGNSWEQLGTVEGECPEYTRNQREQLGTIEEE